MIYFIWLTTGEHNLGKCQFLLLVRRYKEVETNNLHDIDSKTNGLPRTCTQNYLHGVIDNPLIKMKETALKLCFHFSLHRAFPMHVSFPNMRRVSSFIEVLFLLLDHQYQLS